MEVERLTQDWSAAFEWDGDILSRRLFQPSRRQALSSAQLKRNNPGVVEDRDGLGRWCLQIPLEDYEFLTNWSIKWRDLGAKDNTTREKAWRRFLAHADSAPYRVRENAS